MNMKYCLVIGLQMLLGIETSTIYTGTVKLIADLQKVALILAPSISIPTLIYFGIRKMNADEHEAPVWKKRMIGVGIALVIAVTAAGIVPAIVGYYQ